ncbi:MAG: hypothetical protein IJA59_09540 [Clostridia bacterium]|nr:hypothetical protein [Clostridia bacterium]
MKKLLSLVLSFLLLASLCPALADTPPADQIATSGESYVEWYNKARVAADLISYTKAGINARTGSVLVTGATETYSIVDTVGIVFLIQRWEIDEWVNYYSCSCENYDTDTFSDIRTFSVESGHYYRLYAIHKAYQGVQTDLMATITGSVYVN